jgi:hypothetical protein
MLWAPILSYLTYLKSCHARLAEGAPELRMVRLH